MIVRRLLLCLLVMSAAACSSSGKPGSAVPSHSQGSPSAASNRAAAHREAARLLSLVRLPRGAHPLSAAPPHADSAMGVPAATSLVDDKRYWAVPMSFNDTVAWFKAHPPKGHLKSDGSGSGSGPGYQESGTEYAGASNPAWQSADLSLNVTSADTGRSYVRADAIVVWLDPQPIRDTSLGRRIHFSAADGCPKHDRGTPDVRNSGPGLDSAMLPAEQPVRALLCVYGVRGARPYDLTAESSLGAKAAGQVAALVRRVPLSHVDGGISGCPAAFAYTGYAAFDYRDGSSIDLRVDLSGCAMMTNGTILTAAGKAVRLFTQVELRQH